jgi:hypothetical protein
VEVLAKTANCCHICGGKIPSTASWHADHVLSHSDGGAHFIDNYLPAHSLCAITTGGTTQTKSFNGSSKLGCGHVRKMEKGSLLGSELARRFYEYEVGNRKRRKKIKQ